MINRESERALTHAKQHCENAVKAAEKGDTGVNKLEIRLAEGIIESELRRSENSRRTDD